MSALWFWDDDWLWPAVPEQGVWIRFQPTDGLWHHYAQVGGRRWFDNIEIE